MSPPFFCNPTLHITEMSPVKQNWQSFLIVTGHKCEDSHQQLWKQFPAVSLQNTASWSREGPWRAYTSTRTLCRWEHWEWLIGQWLHMVSATQLELGSQLSYPCICTVAHCPLNAYRRGKCWIRVGVSQPVRPRTSISSRTLEWEKTLVLKVNPTVHRLPICSSQIHLIFYMEFLFHVSNVLGYALTSFKCAIRETHSFPASISYIFRVFLFVFIKVSEQNFHFEMQSPGLQTF